MDALLLLGLLPRTGVLIKSRDTRQPMYALLARHFDLLSVDRHSLESVAASLEKGRRLLAEGKNLLVFPEGTRARSGRLQHFNRVRLRPGLAARVPVRAGDRSFHRAVHGQAAGQHLSARPQRVPHPFLDPETPRPDDAPLALCDRVHRRMARELRDAGRRHVLGR